MEGVHEPQCLHVVADPEVLADLVVDYVLGADCDYRLGLVPELHQHPDLAVRHEAGKRPGCVVVVEELASELQIQLASGAADAFADVLGLRAEIEVVVETRHVSQSMRMLLINSEAGDSGRIIQIEQQRARIIDDTYELFTYDIG